MNMELKSDRRKSVLPERKPSQSAKALLPWAGAITFCLFLASCGEKAVGPAAGGASVEEAGMAHKAMKSNAGDPIVRYSQGRFSNSGQQLGGRVGKVAPATQKEADEARGLIKRLRSNAGNRQTEEEVRAAAAALETDAVVKVAKALLDSPTAETRAAALNLLAGSDSAEAAALLRQAFGDSDADVRQLAFQSAAVLQPDRLEPGLLAGMEDGELAVRQAAFQAATAQAGPTAEKAIQKGVNSAHGDITLAALTHLEVSMQKNEVPTVINAMGHTDPQIRGLAGEILATLTYQTFASVSQAKQWWQANQHHFDPDLVVNSPENYPAFNLNR